MASYGGFYKGEKRKRKKELLEREADKVVRVYTPPKVEIIEKGKKNK